MIKQPFGSYIDKLDRDIFPFVSYEGYDDKYPTLTAQEFDESFYREVRYASKELFNIFCKVTKVFQNAPDNFIASMDMPKEIIPFLNIPNKFNLPTWLSRFDFVLDKDNKIHMVELNADTPCFIIESFYGNKVASDSFLKWNPNSNSMSQLESFVKKVYDGCKPLVIDLKTKDFQKGTFVFSCFDDYEEDFATTKYLMNVMKQQYPFEDIRFLSFYDIQIDDKGIVLPDNSYASALYRLHPMEILIDEKTADGESLGEMFLDLYKNNSFHMFNPPEALILQNKSFMSLVWAIYRSGKYFDNHEREIIEKYLVPSYFEEDFVNLDKGKYICKEIWGREGRNVYVVEKNNGQEKVVNEKLVDNYEDIVCRESNKSMYQNFIEQQSFTHIVDSGEKNGFLTISCFMLFDQPSAISCRFSPEEIAGTEAYWCPMVIG